METFYFFDKSLSSLDKSEHKRFRKFLDSPYFHKNHVRTKRVIKFYDLVKMHFNGNNHSNIIDWKKIIWQIYPEKKADTDLYKKLLVKVKSDFLSCFLVFIVNENFNKDKLLHEILLMNELDMRKLADIFVHFFKSRRFGEHDKNYSEPQKSFYWWKLYQSANKHRERYGILSETESRNSLHSLENKNEVDFDIEKMLLKEYFKNELKQVENRMRKAHRLK